MTRDDRQLIGAQRALAANSNGILHYVQRFGKTNTIIKLIEIGLYEEVIVIVPNDSIKRQWEYHTSKLEISKVTVRTARRFIKNNDIPFTNLLVLDEVHKYLTPELYPLISGEAILADKVIGLTGTIPDGNDRVDLVKWLPIIDVISEKEAIANEWISDYREYNLGVNLPERDKERYKDLSRTVSKMLEIFKGAHTLITVQGRKMFWSDMDLLYACTRGKFYSGKMFQAEDIRNALARHKGWSQKVAASSNSYAEMTDKYWNPVIIKEHAMAFSRATIARNSILSSSMVKLNLVLQIVKKFHVPTIIFNESVKFSEDVALNVENVYPGESCVFHSSLHSRFLRDTTGEYITYKNGKPKKFGAASLKKLAIEGLRSGKFKYLSTVKALDEGIDVPNLEVSIITAGTLNPLQQSQRAARVKTLDTMNTSKEPKIINLYFRDFILNDEYVRSRDLTKLISRQATNETEPFWITDVDEIT